MATSVRLLTRKNSLLPAPSVILNHCLNLSLQPNFVDMYGLFTTTHTFPLFWTPPSMVWCFATPLEQICLEQDKYGFHLPEKVAKSWKTLEQSCCQATSVLHSSFEHYHTKLSLTCLVPIKPSEFSYFMVHSFEEKARSAISESLDGFVILFAYLSFCIAICKLFCLSERTNFILNGFKSYQILQLLILPLDHSVLARLSTLLNARGFILSLFC